MHDYNARYYSAVLGRFVSADTIVPDFGNPQDLNRYSYVINKPLRFVDPDGHCRGLAGVAYNACVNIVTALAPAVHKANEYREDIFFPDENTTFGDRLEASTIVGSGATLVSAIAAEGLAVAEVSLYSAHAAAMEFASAHPFLAGMFGGVAETASECAMAGGCTPGDFVAGGLTGGVTSVSSQPKQYPEGTLIDTRNGEVIRPLDVSELEYITRTPRDVHLPADHTQTFSPKEYKGWRNFAGWLMHAIGGIFPDKTSKNIQETEWPIELLANLSFPQITTGEI